MMRHPDTGEDPEAGDACSAKGTFAHRSRDRTAPEERPLLVGNFLPASLTQESIEVMSVTVSEKGQVAIPVAIRRKLDVKKGERLILAVKGRKVLIEKSADIAKRMEGEFDHLVRLSEESAKALWGNPEDEVWDDV